MIDLDDDNDGVLDIVECPAPGVSPLLTRFDLNSGGTIFDDLNREIDIDEVGAFVQVGKKIADAFKLTFSGRYDKNQNFEGRFTPRITGVYTVAPNNNIRLSYQTGYRNPTTQNQYIDLSVGGGSTRLIGGLPALELSPISMGPNHFSASLFISSVFTFPATTRMAFTGR